MLLRRAASTAGQCSTTTSVHHAFRGSPAYSLKWTKLQGRYTHHIALWSGNRAKISTRLTRRASTVAGGSNGTPLGILQGNGAGKKILKANNATVEGGSKGVALWLFGTAGAVAVMVTVGGITRMTKSGLSMTDWKLQGSLPPITQAEWEAEFDRYKTFPEWQQRRSMTLAEFKTIYFWEYAHRMLGRTLGLVYGLPLLYFGLRGRIPKHIRGRVAGLFALGGAQGLVGWWMVKSGLENRKADLASGKEIRVSPYRLAAHLATAFVTFSLLVHTGLLALNGPLPSSLLAVAQRLVDAGMMQHASRLRVGAAGVCGLAFVTAVSGAFVAGNDAGRCYNCFPKMTEDTWLPEEILALRPMWRNFFENSATVQADHRALALTTTAAALGLFWYAKRGAASGVLWAALPAGPKAATSATAGLVTAQASLGITTLLHAAPLPLAATHQAGALAVLASSIWAAHSLRFAQVGLPRPPLLHRPSANVVAEGVDAAVTGGAKMR